MHLFPQIHHSTLFADTATANIFRRIPGLLTRASSGALTLTVMLLVTPYFAEAQTLPTSDAKITQFANITKGPSAEGITEYRFSNGFKLLLLPDATKPTVTVNMTYLVGSRQENYGETGMAHLLEHMMFKGTPTHPTIPKDFGQRGMSFNGTTSLDRTNYYEFSQASDDNLKWAIDLEADRMLHSFVARKDLDSEMTVVRNEFEKGENSPVSVLFKRMQGVAFDWHSYGKPTIGNRSDVESVKIENLQAFYRTYYQPDNAVLLISGKFDTEKALTWVNEAFGKLPKPSRKLPEFWTVEPTQDGERSFVIRREGDIQIVAVAYKVPSELHPDSNAISFAASILADTPNGRLYKALVETGKATSVFNYEMTGYAPGLLVIAAVVKKNEPIEPVRAALVDAIESFSTTPPTAEEMDRIKRNTANGYENLMNDPQQIGVAMSSAIALGDWRLLFLGRDQLKQVTSAQVAEVAAKYFKRDNRTVGIFQPNDPPQRAEVPAAPALAEILKDYKPQQGLASGEIFDPSQANIDARTQHQTFGDMKLAMLPKKTRGETVSVHIKLNWGDEKTLFDKNAVSDMTGAMLRRGSTTLNRQQLADAFSKLKVSGSLYQFETTRSDLPGALALVADVFQHPRFDPLEFERLRKEVLVGLEASRNNPDSRAAEAMAQHFNLYPKGDWLSAPTVDEKIANIKAVTLEQVIAFHKAFYGASHSEIAIVGDFDPIPISKTVQAEFGNWKSASPYQRVIRKNFDVAPIAEVINTPDKENGVYIARMNLDMRDSDPDYPALLVANYLFGGGSLKSRLADRIRQKDGLSYSVGSSLGISAISRAASFSIQAIAAPQNLSKVDLGVKEELARVRKDGFTADELTRAKSGILQENVQARAQDGAVGAGWVRLLDLDRTYAWSKQLEDKISALTLDQINKAFHSRIDPAQLSVVIARDETKINNPNVARP
ncbi:pitrilysin family protein [Glaciimonas sp. CA11.2]|nr:pitrilysin family protein [Glaciimonas sp. CA11.2]MDY7547075.1 pitrilysin family protein [Glaciimonas sp. CA11.2]MEB0162296.1 pitrilysin family protein [Glaciimonas sp. CA11.2]